VDPLAERTEDPEEARRMVRRTTRRFVEYLHLVRPRDGEDGGDLDVRLEVEVGDEEEAEAADEEGITIETETAVEGDDDEPERGIVRRIRVPDDPGTLAHLLSGIVQIDLVQKQALLEADTVEERLAGLEAVLDQELLLLGRRLRRFEPDARATEQRRN